MAGYIVPLRVSGLSNSYTIRGIRARSGRSMSGKASTPRRKFPASSWPELSPVGYQPKVIPSAFDLTIAAPILKSWLML